MTVVARVAFKSIRYIARSIHSHSIKLAKQIYKKILQEYITQAEESMELGEYAVATKQWQRIEKRFGRRTPTAVYLQLFECYKKQNLGKSAENALVRGKLNRPLDTQLYVAHVEYAIERKKYEKSRVLWQEMAEVFGTTIKPRLWAKFSQLYRQNKQYAYAEAIMDDCLSEWPDDRKLLIEHAEIPTDKGDFEDALKRWQWLRNIFNTETPVPINGMTTRVDLYISILERLVNFPSYKEKIESYRAHKARSKKNKIVLYTAVSGGYDTLKLPEYINPDYDYVIFSDQPVPDTGIFEVRPLPFIHEDPTRSARYVKTHPHTLLSDYETAVWVDASIIIKGDLGSFIEKFFASRKPIGAIPHPLRRTIYQEAEACIALGKDDQNTLINQVKRYRSMEFAGTDMIESGFIMFNLRHPGISSFFNAWWKEIDTFSRRDQLSFGFALKSSGMHWYALTRRPNSVRNDPNFILAPHSVEDRVSQQLIDRLAQGVVDPEKKFTIASEEVPENRIKTVDIIVCVHNALDEVTKCLNSIVKHRGSDKEKLIIVNDGSDKETSSYLTRFAAGHNWVELHRNKRATGYTRAANKGLLSSSADLVILANSDTVVTKGWVEKMSRAVNSHPSVGIVGPLSSAASHQSIPEHISKNNQTAINELPPGTSIDKMNRYVERWAKNSMRPLVPLVHGFCFGITRELIDAIGYFDEKAFPRGYGEENDYCFRATDAGFSLVIAIDTYIFHTKSKSYDSAVRVGLMQKGAQQLNALHGVDRVQRAVGTMQKNPTLIKMRTMAAKLYES
jgi:GT2 family glycosyltransferase